ncbi:unnamed protein product [Dicrocoelium dendriticum]|nr:unnamed protein product [Dicrocoelium dendriticum]
MIVHAARDARRAIKSRGGGGGGGHADECTAASRRTEAEERPAGAGFESRRRKKGRYSKYTGLSGTTRAAI